MDSGLSWADQWDSHPDPPPSNKEDKKKTKLGSAKIKSILSLKWMKDLGSNKKSEKS
ncbi:uncharacterized protein LOC114736737 [Neltuma alba]|uniref:uncharacterized protein LOC114728567 n=1 Tax=Neltuma alba TaxID=207710 RepID=UPI0010A3D5F7|nr:uncharacterized protein LOC114728567 [Prosopis alba]XP_028780441.1 uncharacterized protein LOC114736737 [Prosopis alba]